jgi:hypothetical protein
MAELAAIPQLPAGEYVWIMPGTLTVPGDVMPVTPEFLRVVAVVDHLFKGAHLVEVDDLRSAA